MRKLPEEATLEALLTAAQAEEYALLERLHYYGIMRAQEIGVLGWDHASRRVQRMSEVTLRDMQSAVAVYRNGFNQYVAMYVSTPPPTPVAQAVTVDRYASRTFPNGLVAVVKSNPDSRMLGATVLLLGLCARFSTPRVRLSDHRGGYSFFEHTLTPPPGGDL